MLITLYATDRMQQNFWQGKARQQRFNAWHFRSFSMHAQSAGSSSVLGLSSIARWLCRLNPCACADGGVREYRQRRTRCSHSPVEFSHMCVIKNTPHVLQNTIPLSQELIIIIHTWAWSSITRLKFVEVSFAFHKIAAAVDAYETSCSCSHTLTTCNATGSEIRPFRKCATSFDWSVNYERGGNQVHLTVY